MCFLYLGSDIYYIANETWDKLNPNHVMNLLALRLDKKNGQGMDQTRQGGITLTRDRLGPTRDE